MSNPSKTSEYAFETEIVEHLTANGWEQGDPKNYRAELALDPVPLLAFIQETQPDQWAKFADWHNGEAEEVFLKKVREYIADIGVIRALRREFKSGPARFFLCQFKPAHGANPKILADYQANRMTVTRQVHYSPNRPAESIDLVLFVNGIPVATSELKTDMTQGINDAKRQYRQDRPTRDPKTKYPEPLLLPKTGAIVHFAVSTDEVWMTTKLAGNRTYFLPFNRGHDQGAGNPPAESGGYPVEYLFQEIWQRDHWLEILGRFTYVAKEETVDPNTQKVTEKEAVIFPRYHQRQLVKRLVDAARAQGPGRRYLVQHSAGSGKTKSISWLAHQLSDLHDDQDEKVFSTVVVITDRTVLDNQLQDAIYEIDHQDGVVAKIDEDSTQLAEALGSGRKIIVSTLQKFPFVMEKVGDLSDRTFAVIVDEAHSSQTGKAAANLRQVLSELGVDGPDAEDEVTAEDVMVATMEKRRPPPNMSYFAFTATPKPKTLELFGERKQDGTYEAFDVYSMRQAIEEKFILDVLEHYVPYKTLYKLATTSDPEVSESRARKAIARYLTLHPHSIAQKVEIIVEHFREQVMKKIGGRAKAMIVTDSRKAAVRYKLAVDRYIQQQGYEGLGTLVAFSGSVNDPESGSTPFTEDSMNDDGLADPKIKKAFGQAGYRVLIVANKYQTGFDQPLLHTMYVDKRLDGVLAVQTLSRLNRTHPQKRDTCVVDFRNEPADILKAFLPFYRTARLSEGTDPDLLHKLLTKLRDIRIFMWSEVQGFAEAFYSPSAKQAPLHGFLKPAADRYDQAKPEVQATFRKDLGSFVRGYDFLSMVLPFSDEEWEALAVYGRALLPRLGRPMDPGESGEDAIQLTHFRVQKLSEKALSLEEGEAEDLEPSKLVGSAVVRDPKMEHLAVIVAQMNDLFTGELSDADMVAYAEHVSGRLAENDSLAEQAESNSIDQFALGDYKTALQDAVIDGLDAYNGMARQLINDQDKLARFAKVVLPLVYDRLKASARGPDDAGAESSR